MDPEDGERRKLSRFTARYTAEEAASYAAEANYAVDNRFERKPTRTAELTDLGKLAKKSKWYKELQGRPPHEVGAGGPINKGYRQDSWSRPDRATKGTPSSKAGGLVSGGLGTVRETDPEDEELTKPYATLALASDDGDDFEDEEGWTICSDGLGATQPGAGGEPRAAPDWSQQEDEGVPPADSRSRTRGPEAAQGRADDLGCQVDGSSPR